jgi:alkylation response protein AidB-like acyl-CoA dehydrogenase
VPIGIGEDHLALHQTASGWVERHCPPPVPRALLDTEPAADELPPFWGALAEVGWLGLHLPEQHGGQGYGLGELVVVLEELGRAVAPGPFLPSALFGAVIARWGDEEAKAALLPGLASGEVVGTVVIGSGRGHRAVPSGHLATHVLVPLLGLPDEQVAWEVWPTADLQPEAQQSLDRTRRVAWLHAESAGPVARLDLPATAVQDLAAVLFAAEGVGMAAWCVDTASEHAKVREQFGSPIGRFQAVKHRCADMLCALEVARAVTWDAARAWDDVPVGALGGESLDQALLASAIAGALVPDAAARCAKDCIQVLGGIGFTWEHDAHLYLKRATANRQLLGGPMAWRGRVTELARRGVRRGVQVELPPEAEPLRDEVRAFVLDLEQRPKDEWRVALADAGYLVPAYPEPWGRGAGPIEQLVIDDEMAKAHVRRPHLQVGAWVLPTLVVHGTEAQQERWVPPTLRGELSWCQMFSEPGAGSDLASLTTKAVRVDGGWSISGQKVWTTMADLADWAICLARTDPSAPKHEGITCFIVDMTTPGIDIRPLRELTGHEMFNEVFLNDVFVPDDAVVGPVDGGWKAARTTLENERVSMGSGSSFGPGVEGVLRLTRPDPELAFVPDPLVDDEVGGLLATAQALSIMGLRTTLRAMSGAKPGPESSVSKLVGVEHEQRVQEAGLALLASDGVLDVGDGAMWIGGFLGNRCLTIAGGTSEVQRNVIGERLLGLPRDP